MSDVNFIAKDLAKPTSERLKGCLLMAMTEQERKELKEGMKRRLEERVRQQGGKNGCLMPIVITIFILILCVFIINDQDDDATTTTNKVTRTQFVSPNSSGVSELEAKKQIANLLAHTKKGFYYSGSLRHMNPSEFSTRGGERANVRKYNEKWVAMTNEVAVKALTSGVCSRLESASVMTITETPLNPEITVDCDGKEYEGLYRDLMAGEFMNELDFKKKQADEYYAKAPNEYDAANACYNVISNMAKDPDSLDYYPSTGHSGTRPGKDGPEFFLTEDFTAKNSFGANVRNTFYCTVSSSGETTVTFAHP